MPRYSLAYAALMAVGATAQQSLYQQCGGSGWTGATSCVDGTYCASQNDYYYQCLAGTATAAVSAAAYTPSSGAKTTFVTLTRPASACTPESESSSTAAAQASSAKAYSSSPAVTSAKASSSATPASSATPISSAQAVSSAAAVAVSSSQAASSAAAASASTVAASSAVVASGTSSAAAASTSSASSTSGQTTYAGVNIAGFDFGCSTDGTCSSGGYTDVSTSGVTQIQHFVTDDKLNAFRLPIGWQHITNQVLGGDLYATVADKYDTLVQGCLKAADLCILDIHNYARWNGEIIGQGGPTDAQFADIWTKLATKYAAETKIAFGIMNEPHDLTMTTWATSVQAAVTAIRDAGATSQLILLPGTGYTSAYNFGTNSGTYLLNVTDSDGSTDKLIFDVHRYLDSDNSGTSTECVTNNVDDTFTPLTTWLTTNKRKAFLSETGGGNTASCEEYVCQQLDYINQNSDVYLGYTGWAAGGFDTSYALSLTPSGSTDTALASKCFSRA